MRCQIASSTRRSGRRPRLDFRREAGLSSLGRSSASASRTHPHESRPARSGRVTHVVFVPQQTRRHGMQSDHASRNPADGRVRLSPLHCRDRPRALHHGYRASRLGRPGVRVQQQRDQPNPAKNEEHDAQRSEQRKVARVVLDDKVGRLRRPQQRCLKYGSEHAPVKSNFRSGPLAPLLWPWRPLC